jgi:hypothetical protein
VPRTWAHMRAELAEALRLTDQQEENVDIMIDSSMKGINAPKLNFDCIVTNENIKIIIGYNNPASDVPFVKVRKSKTQKSKDGSEVATPKGKEKV